MKTLQLQLNLIDEDMPAIDIDFNRFESLSAFVLQDLAEAGEWEIAVVLTTDDKLRELHKEFMGIDEVTDVMTFPADPSENDGIAGGDIVISVDRAAEQGSDFGHTPKQEIEFLLVHGLLHLCGWMDHSEADRAKMLTHQGRLIARFDADQD
jgi:probable rRNA maturation factor